MTHELRKLANNDASPHSAVNEHSGIVLEAYTNTFPVCVCGVCEFVCQAEAILVVDYQALLLNMVF